MGDEGDFWRDVRAARQQKRASNRETSTALLREAGIEFDERNAGAHLIIRRPGCVFDFWPGTGKWVCRGERGFLCERPKRGVRSLIRAVQQEDS